VLLGALAGLAACLLAPRAAKADTFSIAAADPASGRLGSAGASCVPAIGGIGAFILSDVLPGVGVIHTQAAYLAANQANARERMLAGDSPQEVLDWVTANDAARTPAVRQYGIVDLRLGGESAAYTGAQTTAWAGHATGTGYAIQGNILLGPEIVSDMEGAWLLGAHLESMPERLMQTLEAAMVVGADTRCAPRLTSSQSAFLRVDDPGGAQTVQIVVPDTVVGQDPIAEVRRQLDAWSGAPTVTPTSTPTDGPSPSPTQTTAATSTPTREATPLPTAPPTFSVFLPRCQSAG
jgi:uncharacterized Ntn-hydrolase superfamily protein